MDLFHITYQIAGNASQRELFLNVRAKRWSERSVIRTVIKNEFPAAVLPPMKFKQWKAEIILESFGIINYQICYLDVATFDGVTQKSGIVPR
jgi:hypothetical protein